MPILLSIQPDLPSHLHHPQLAIAVEAARRGAEIVRDYYFRGTEIRTKSSFNLVTDADIRSEQAIAQAIRDAFPEHAILSEEENTGAINSEHLWVIDPLDGTNNFAHQIPHFAISIAYTRDGKSEVGVIVDPIRNEWYFAVQGQGAWHTGQQARVSNEQSLGETMIGIGFFYDRGIMMEATLLAIRDFFHQQIHGVRRFGTASLDLCQVGLGRYGAYFEFQLQPWDFAAGMLFLTEAGGMITTCEGKPIPLTPTSCLASNTRLHPLCLEITSRYWKNEKPYFPEGKCQLGGGR